MGFTGTDIYVWNHFVNQAKKEVVHMIFTTDKQTLEDLTIFGRQGSDSVYTIFNRTTTRGGASILEEMFRYPLSDEQAINRRSGIIRYFAALGITFPFLSSHF